MDDTNYVAVAHYGEINRALTEYLFGEDNKLIVIPFDIASEKIAKRLATDPISGKTQYLTMNHSAPPPQESYRDSLKNKVRYYVRRRHIQGQTAQYNPIHYYEQQIYKKHWPGKDNRYVQLLIVKGIEGVGKSTFLRYYFQYYLPNLYEICGRNNIIFGSKKQWQAEWDQHLVLYVNLKRISSTEQLKNKLYSTFRDQISEHFPDLDTEECYAMWDYEVHGWDRKLHKDSQESQGLTLEQYRAKYITDHKHDFDNEKWVSAAIRYLASKRTKENKRKWFITWVLDDVDLIHVEVQRKLIEFILSKIAGEERKIDVFAPVKDPSLALWKVIIPLRPETLRILWPSLYPLPNMYDPLVLGELFEQDLLITRGGFIEKEIIDSDRHVQHNIQHVKNQQPKLEITPPKAAGRSVRNWFTAEFSNDSGTSIEDGTAKAARELYKDLGNGSTRRKLLLRRRLTLSRGVMEQLERARKSDWQLPLSAFYFIDGMTCGDKGYYEPNEVGNLILNLFDLGGNPQTPHSILVGCHAIFLLNRNEANDWKRVSDDLSSIGYWPDIDICRDHFLEKELLKDIGASEKGGRRYYIERKIVRAHWRLLRERSYLDNMAISMGGTIPRDFAKHIKETSCTLYQDFIKRVWSTITFLAYLKECEQDICYVETARDQHKKSDNEFVNIFNNLRLPSVYTLVASAYGKIIKRRIHTSFALKKELIKQQDEWDNLESSQKWIAISDLKYDKKNHLKAIITKQ